MDIKIVKLTPTVKIPTRESLGAAGFDLYTDLAQPVIVPPHGTIKFPTNIAIEIPTGYFGAVYCPTKAIRFKTPKAYVQLDNIISGKPDLSEKRTRYHNPHITAADLMKYEEVISLQKESP